VFTVELVKQPGLVVALRITDEREEGITVKDVISAGNDGTTRSNLRLRLNKVPPVNELDCGPHRDCRKRIEDLLNAFVHFTDVLNGQASVVDLQGTREVGLPEVPQRPPFEVKIFERSLEGCQAGRLR
jgi:hypothetical protein